MQLKLLFSPSADIIVHKKSVNGNKIVYIRVFVNTIKPDESVSLSKGKKTV